MRLVFEQRIVERLFKQPYFNRTVCAIVSTADFRRLRVTADEAACNLSGFVANRGVGADIGPNGPRQRAPAAAHRYGAQHGLQAKP
jgi:hypothetical protein